MNKQKQRSNFSICLDGRCLLPLLWCAQTQGSDFEVKLHFLVQPWVCTLRLLPFSRIFGESTFLCSRLLFLKQWWLQCWGHHWMKTWKTAETRGYLHNFLRTSSKERSELNILNISLWEIKKSQLSNLRQGSSKPISTDIKEYPLTLNLWFCWVD